MKLPFLSHHVQLTSFSIQQQWKIEFSHHLGNRKAIQVIGTLYTGTWSTIQNRHMTYSSQHPHSQTLFLDWRLGMRLFSYLTNPPLQYSIYVVPRGPPGELSSLVVLSLKMCISFVPSHLTAKIYSVLQSEMYACNCI